MGELAWASYKKKVQVPNMNIYIFTAQMLQNLIDVVIKTSNNIFQLSRDAGTT